MSVRREWARWFPWAVLALGAGLSIEAARASARRALSNAQTSFDRRTNLAIAATSDRLRVCIQVARAAAGLFVASEDVTRGEWREYVQHSAADTTCPGLVALEFVERVPRAALAAHVRRVRAKGLPGYQVWPAGDGEAAYPIVYAEAVGRPPPEVLGFDIGSERVRREALERARDSGLPALSGRITLIQDSTSAPVPSLTVLAPVYRFGMPAGTGSDRRQALIGLVAAVVRAPGLVGGVLGGIRGVDVEVFDVLEVRAGAVLYDADSILHGLGGAPTPRFTRTETIRIAGRPWTLFLSSQPGFERRAARPGPALLLLGGLAPSLAVCLALRSQFLAGERAEVLASGMTAELREAQTSLEQDVAERRRVEAALRESEERYRTLLENTPVGIYVDVGGRFVYANRELVRILGAASSAEVLGRAVLPHIAPPFRTAVAERMASGRAEATLSRELQLVGLDGKLIDVEASAVPTVFDGQPAMQVKVRDISDRTEAERRAPASRLSCARLKRWRPSARSPAGSPTTSITSSARSWATPSWRWLTRATTRLSRRAWRKSTRRAGGLEIWCDRSSPRTRPASWRTRAKCTRS